MNYLADTNVLSELVKAKPDAQVVKWFAQLPLKNIFLSVLTLGEIRKGIESVADVKRKEKLRIWLEHELPEAFHQRILAITFEVADRWGRLQGELKRPLPAIDSLIAATALHHDLALVTRNTADFVYPGLEVINPWNFKN